MWQENEAKAIWGANKATVAKDLLFLTHIFVTISSISK